MKWFYRFCVGLFFALSSAFGQGVLSDFKTLDANEGLSQGSVCAIYQDRKGFLWIGTGDGLNRYDGKQVKVFKAATAIAEPSNANLIRGNIAEDNLGNIWYSAENGLYMVSKSTNEVRKKHSFFRNQLDGSDFLLCFIDDDQTIWLQSIANGLASYSIHTGKFSVTPRSYELHHKSLMPQYFNLS